MDEIDEKQPDAEEIPINEIAERIEETLHDCLRMPLITDCFGRRLNRKTWLLLFHTPSKSQIKQWTSTKAANKRWRKKQPDYNHPAPFESYCKEITEEQLLQIYDAIPKDITNANGIDYVHEEKFVDLGKWMIEYKNDAKNKESKQVVDKIYDGIIRYAYWLMLQRIVTDYSKSVSDAAKFYRKYHEYIDINQQKLDDGWTVKYIYYPCIYMLLG